VKRFDNAAWVGRRFLCKTTGEILVIPEDVRARQFYSFGDCFVDVGDGFYARFGGAIMELDLPKKESADDVL
jgi:hypothetical protein